jgi:hypothetical protein
MRVERERGNYLSKMIGKVLGSMEHQVETV